jgi:hypothetical protein
VLVRKLARKRLVLERKQLVLVHSNRFGDR